MMPLPPSSPANAAPAPPLAAATSDEQRKLERQELLRETRPFWLVMATLVGVSLLVVLCWQFASSNTGLLYATLGLGCLIAGGVIGFLFGIPNTDQAKRNLAAVAPAGPAATDQPGTNLEQVSDWLTKIIIGVGLVESTRIMNSLATLGKLVGSETGEPRGNGSVVVPQLLVVIFGILGFACGYIWTRLYYGSVQMTLDFNLRRWFSRIEQKADAAIGVAGGLANNAANAVPPAAPQGGPPTPGEQPEMVATVVDAKLADWNDKLRQFQEAKGGWNDDTTARIFNPARTLLATDNGRSLKVTRVADLSNPSTRIFFFTAQVFGTVTFPLQGEVTLLLHPSFGRPVVVLKANTRPGGLPPGGMVEYSFSAAGSFTLIAMTDDGHTVLAYDLAELGPPNW